jgi:ABC-type sugar transport system permease subunit
MNKKALYYILSFMTLILLILGLFYPMLSIELNALIDAGVAKFENTVFSESRSIIETSRHLWAREKYLVSLLIFIFSVILPLAKNLLFFRVIHNPLYRRGRKLISLISKWSMVDVFVIALFLAFLATDGQGHIKTHQATVFGMRLNIKVLAQMSAELKIGFYFFLSHCLLLMGIFQYWDKSHPEKPVP